VLTGARTCFEDEAARRCPAKHRPSRREDVHVPSGRARKLLPQGAYVDRVVRVVSAPTVTRDRADDPARDYPGQEP
jgi:hypothetical protein